MLEIGVNDVAFETISREVVAHFFEVAKHGQEVGLAICEASWQCELRD